MYVFPPIATCKRLVRRRVQPRLTDDGRGEVQEAEDKGVVRQAFAIVLLPEGPASGEASKYL